MTKVNNDLFDGGSLRRPSVNAHGELAVDTTSEASKLREQCYRLIHRYYGLGASHHKRQAMKRLVNSRRTVQELREVRTMIKRATTTK